MLNVLDVSRYVVNYSHRKNYIISNLRLQKLLYFIQAYYLTFTKEKKPCFDAEIQAWDFGPVVPEAYHEYKRFGSGTIPMVTHYIFGGKDDIWSAKIVEFDEKVIPKRDKKIIESVVDAFSGYSTTGLVELTHNQKPWKDAYRQSKSTVIGHGAIREYFSR